MRIVSWNVNGLRACINKGFYDFAAEVDADIICCQETKMHPGQAVVEIAGYEQFWNSAVKKGYSGTVIFSRIKPLAVTYDIGIEEHSREGRVITAEYENFYLVNVYTPNSQNELKRLDYRMRWEDDFREYLQKLDKTKPVILCGDLNVAHNEIDLKNPKTNRMNAGFTDQERGKFSELLAAGVIDTFRYFYPDKTGAYSWWSYIGGARSRNAGWRIDYFLVSDRLRPAIEAAPIYHEIYGSDHCPVGLELKEELL